MIGAAPRPMPFGVERAAIAITEVTSPTLLAPALLLVVAVHDVQGHGLVSLGWGAVSALFSGVLPLVFLKFGVRQGLWDDHHVRDRARRRVPLLFALGSVLAGEAALIAGRAPRDLIVLVAAMLAGLTAVLLISHWWKVSIHSAVAGGSAVVLGMVLAGFGAAAGLLILLAAAVARVVLRDHTLPQVVVGAAVGAFCAAAIFSPLH